MPQMIPAVAIPRLEVPLFLAITPNTIPQIQAASASQPMYGKRTSINPPTPVINEATAKASPLPT